jgi:hypothetical protein
MIPLTVPEAGRLLGHPRLTQQSATGWTGATVTWPAPGRARPRTYGLKSGRSAAPGVLLARMPYADARKAQIAQGYGRYSSQESSHGIPGRAREDRSQ